MVYFMIDANLIKGQSFMMYTADDSSSVLQNFPSSFDAQNLRGHQEN